MAVHLIFVYGTLKKNGKATAFVHGDLFDLWHFPGAQNVGNETAPWIRGQVIVVDDLELRQLDRYEGVPKLYTREKILIFDEIKNPLCIGWIYQYAGEQNGRRCPDGEWHKGIIY